MNFKNIKYVYFLGIGGIGMSALARYFKAFGKEVAGYDKTPTKITDELITEGINIHFEDNINSIPELFKSPISHLTSHILIIYTPAVPKSHSEYVYFQQHGFNMIKRAQALGLITEQQRTIAVAGTHGKTTTSSIITHILKTANIDCSAFLGGITKNYHTNFILGEQLKLHVAGTELKSTIVVEADEYDRSFLTLYPEIAVITSLDADHLDIYGDKKYMEESYSLFSRQVKQEGRLIIKKAIQPILNCGKRAVITYSISPKEDATYKAKDIIVKNGQYVYTIVCPGKEMKDLTLGLPGLHNVENAVAATAVADQMHISEKDIRKALATFEGVKRRFDYQIKSKDLVFIDDYAHHPEELKACILSVKQLYPEKKVTGIFQPHLFTRTRDFVNEFARSLELLDELILMEIYPARELPIKGVSSQMLLDKINLKNKILCQKAELLNEISKRKIEVLLTLGAGDIDTFVEPIKKVLTKN